MQQQVVFWHNWHSLAYTTEVPIEALVEVLKAQIEVQKIASTGYGAIGSKFAQSLTFGAEFGIFLNSVDFVRLVQSLARLVGFVWQATIKFSKLINRLNISKQHAQSRPSEVRNFVRKLIGVNPNTPNITNYASTIRI